MGYIDLHTHSTYSDGYKNISELISLAKENNISTFAITDHDDVRSFEILKSLAKREGISIVSGIEMSTYYINPKDNIAHKIHLLGYGIDVYNNSLLDQLSNYRNIRYKENISMLNNMMSNGIYIPNCIFDEVKFDNYLSILTEMKRVLVKNDYDYEFVKNFINKAKSFAPNYKNYEIEIFTAMSLIIEAGGIPVLAHPHEIKMTYEEKDVLVKKLKSKGLKGIESYCSEAVGREVFENLKLAQDNKLMTSVGSDYHRPDSNNKTIGKGINNNLCKDSCSLVDYLENDDLLIK